MIWHGLKALCTGYYMANLCLVASFGLVHQLMAERGRSENSKLANARQLDAWEKQAGLMLAIVLGIKVFRKQSTAALSADLLFYCKAAAAALCYYVDLHAFILYCVGAVLVFLLFPYQSNYGSGKVELLTPASLRERLKEQREGQAAWLVLLYASWSSACQIFDPTFGELADRYTQPDKLRFGKLEISRWPRAAEEHKVSLALGAQELPTVLLYERGKVTQRLGAPIGSVLKGGLTESDCIRHFNIHKLLTG